MPAPSLHTSRLKLRHWKDSDFSDFALMNQDPKVMEFFPALLSEKESFSLAKMMEKELLEKPYGFWAVEVENKHPFIGFVGLHKPSFEAFFTPCIEIGWRLGSFFWRKGYAYEAAQKVLEYAFKDLELPEIVSFTAQVNLRSIHLMEKLNMKRNPKEDFDHPNVEKDHVLKKHVLYRLKRDDFFKVI